MEVSTAGILDRNGELSTTVLPEVSHPKRRECDSQLFCPSPCFALLLKKKQNKLGQLLTHYMYTLYRPMYGHYLQVFFSARLPPVVKRKNIFLFVFFIAIKNPLLYYIDRPKCVCVRAKENVLSSH